MKCNFEWLSAYLDGELPENQRAQLEEHLKTCEACAAKLDELARLEAAAKKIAVPQLSEAYWENFAGRVQNKIAIRERQKLAPVWLENLKRFFEPTTGKLAIAGSLATILLVAIAGREYWKKEAYQPPAFESERTMGIVGRNDSLQKPTLQEGTERQEETDKLAASGRRDEPVLQKNGQENKQKELSPSPASKVASKPAEENVFRSTTKDEKAYELDLDKGRLRPHPAEENAPAVAVQPVQRDTVNIIAGRKANIRKEVATSQVKVSAEEIEKLTIRNADDLLKNQSSASAKNDRIQHQDSNVQTYLGDKVGVRTPTGSKDSTTKSDLPKTAVQGFTFIKSGGDAQYGNVATEQLIQETLLVTGPPTAKRLTAMPPVEREQATSDMRKVIAEKEKQLDSGLLKSPAESLYVYLSNYYLQLYRYSLKPEDWKKANKRLNTFLKAEISESTRQKLVAIQAELKKIKK